MANPTDATLVRMLKSPPNTGYVRGDVALIQGDELARLPKWIEHGYAEYLSGAEPEPEDEAPEPETPLEEMTVEQLREKAQALEVEGRSSMNKAELIEAVRAAEAPEDEEPEG